MPRLHERIRLRLVSLVKNKNKRPRPVKIKDLHGELKKEKENA